MPINNGKVDDTFIFGFFNGQLDKRWYRKVSPNRGNGFLKGILTKDIAIVNKQVKPGFTNYQPRDLNCIILKVQKSSKNVQNFKNI